MDLKLERVLGQHPELSLYPNSYFAVNACAIAMARSQTGDRLLVSAGPALLDLFEGEVSEGGKCCPLTHQNRLAVNALFPCTCPRAAGRNVVSFGLGDRLGIANYAHLLCLEDKAVFPVIAQQSKRELDLTGRNYADVLDAAVWAVVKAGWQRGFGADGDHLKREQDIAYALDCGYSMITLDCSDVLVPAPRECTALKTAYLALPAGNRERIEATYFFHADSRRLGLFYTQERLMEIAVAYSRCVDLAKYIYFMQIARAGRPVDFEISLDETAVETAPEAHFFVANELTAAGVDITSLAPRFVGEFQKAVDYIGDLTDFSRDFDRHCAIADYFGYKISVHSGSDKFAVFPAIGARASGRLHLKTSGTSWLEAVRVIALEDPGLYRAMHRNALAHLEEARRYYVVHADTEAIRPLDQMVDEQLPDYMNENDARQLMHITYGFQLADSQIRTCLFDVLGKNFSAYARILGSHIARHVNLLQSEA